MTEASDAAEIRKLKARLERLSTSYDRVSTERDELKARTDGLDELIADLVAPAEVFHKPSDGGERYPGQYRRQGSAEAPAALERAVVNRVGPVEAARLCMPFKAMATALCDADIGKANPLTDKKYFWNHGKGSARKGLAQQADDALICLTVQVGIRGLDVRQYVNVPERDGTFQHRPYANGLDENDDAYPPMRRHTSPEMDTFRDRDGDARTVERRKGEWNIRDSTHTPWYARTDDIHKTRRLGKLAQGGLADKIMDGNRTLEAMGQIIRVLGITDEAGVEFWERYELMLKNKNKWPPYQRQVFDDLERWLEEFVQMELELKNVTPMPQECTEVRGGHKRETLLRVYENALEHLKKHGGLHGDRGGRQLAAALKAGEDTERTRPPKAGSGMAMWEAGVFNKNLTGKLDIMRRKTAEELKELIVNQKVVEAPDGVDIRLPIPPERLDDTPWPLLEDFVLANLGDQTKARSIADRNHAAEKKLIKRHVKTFTEKFNSRP